jgi:hypothetical protein
MDKLEMVRTAVTELGNAPAADLSRFVEQKYGVRIEAKFIPLFKASIQDKDRLETVRQAARTAILQNSLQTAIEPNQPTQATNTCTE